MLREKIMRNRKMISIFASLIVVIAVFRSTTAHGQFETVTSCEDLLNPTVSGGLVYGIEPTGKFPGMAAKTVKKFFWPSAKFYYDYDGVAKFNFILAKGFNPSLAKKLP